MKYKEERRGGGEYSGKYTVMTKGVTEHPRGSGRDNGEGEDGKKWEEKWGLEKD